jgi:hypothetical protein
MVPLTKNFSKVCFPPRSQFFFRDRPTGKDFCPSNSIRFSAKKSALFGKKHAEYSVMTNYSTDTEYSAIRLFGKTRCRSFTSSKILACSNGYSECKICTNSEYEKCPIESCESSPTINPNVAMKDVIGELGLPLSCRHSGVGCKNTATLKKVEKHDKQCKLREVYCQVLNCYMEIQFLELEEHMGEFHDQMSNRVWCGWKYSVCVCVCDRIFFGEGVWRYRISSGYLPHYSNPG